jgi:hypothetical protein
MGVSVFPAASTSTSTPGAANKPPKFTLSATYDISSTTSMNTIGDGNGTAMTYRRTDGCIYFTGSNNTNLWKFNTSTNTASYVGNNLSWSGTKDIVAAYDGTLYASFSANGNASIETPQYSTDAGVTWNYLTSATAGQYRGFMRVIDSGAIGNVTGNIIYLMPGGVNGGENQSWWLGTTRTGTCSAQATGIGVGLTSGGRATFPLRDGDDMPSGPQSIWLGNTPATGATSFEVNRSGSGKVVLRQATVTISNTGDTTRTLRTMVTPYQNSYTWNANIAAYMEPSYDIGKPTTIDSRWILGAYNANPNMLFVIDATNAEPAGGVSLPNYNVTDSWSNGAYTANPVYVSATKKLYVLQANSTSNTSNVSKMHVYDVTTY